jgi:hypothetical protein
MAEESEKHGAGLAVAGADAAAAAIALAHPGTLETPVEKSERAPVTHG